MQTDSVIPDNKLHRRQANLDRFYREMKTLGGVLNLVEVANLLDLSCMVVVQRVKKNKLLAFKKKWNLYFPGVSVHGFWTS